MNQGALTSPPTRILPSSPADPSSLSSYLDRRRPTGNHCRSVQRSEKQSTNEKLRSVARFFHLSACSSFLKCGSFGLRVDEQLPTPGFELPTITTGFLLCNRKQQVSIPKPQVKVVSHPDINQLPVS
jgi:hypothetical protein